MQFHEVSCAYTTGRAPGSLALTRHAVELADLSAGSKVVDLGCGNGESVSYLQSAGLSTVGIDLRAGSRSDVNTVPADITHRLPLETASLGGVLAECSLSLLANIESVLLECARVLRDGGKLMITDLYAREPKEAVCLRSLTGTCVSGILTQPALVEHLRVANFSVEQFEDHSRELREMVARYLFEHGNEQGLWQGGEVTSGGNAIRDALRRARVGYFLCVARRNPRDKE